MAPRWVVLNGVLLAIDAVLMFQLVRTLSTSRPLPQAPEMKVQAPAAAKKEEPEPARPALPMFSVVATRNLFNASRSEAQTAAGMPAVAFPKLNLQGVIVTDSGQIAYLEDPATKRTHGYRVGDSIATGRIERIEHDRIVITRPEGQSQIDILLHDPTRLKSPVAGAQTPPVAPAPPPFVPGAVGPPPPAPPPGPPGTPGFIRRPGTPFPPQQVRPEPPQ